MSSSDPAEANRVLYLQQIEIVTAMRPGIRLKLKIDNNDVPIQQEGQTLTWIPSRSLELSNMSKITIFIKAGHKLVPFGRLEEHAEVSGEEAMDAFWQSTIAISRTIIFDGLSTTVTFKFRPSQTSETIRDAVQKLQTAMKNYRGVMTSSTEQRIDTAIQYAVVVSEMNPFAKLAFGLVKVTFDLLKEQRKYDETIFDLASGIDRILPYATKSLEGIVYEEELLGGVVKRLYDLVEDTANFVVIYAKRGPASRAATTAISSNDRGRIDELKGNFNKLKEDFDRAVDVVALSKAKETEEARLLDRLRPTYVANYQDSRVCMEGTRGAVLDNIMAWVTKPFDGDIQPAARSADKLFWLYGSPGLGKTYVANSLCDRLRKGGNLGGSFFCRRDDPVLCDPKRVLPTLISKLAGMWGPYRRAVARTLHEDPQLHPESIRGEILLKPLQSLIRHPPRTFVLVIDALDECGEPGTRGQLLKCLIEACSLVRWLKIIVTSRAEHDIKLFFDTHTAIRQDLATDDPDHNDIWLFTKHRMRSIGIHRHLPPDWPGEDRVDQIVKRSGGLFIFVETISLFVKDNRDPEQPLHQVLGGELGGEANAELHKLYSTAISSRVGSDTEAFQKIARAIVAVATYRTLCDETLASLTGLEPRIVSSWVDDLSSLLYRDISQGGGIRVRHLSITEFLTGPSCPSTIRVDLQQASADLGFACLETMRKGLKFNVCELETSYLAIADIPDLEDRVKEKIPDALRYSCMHWSDHLCSNSASMSMEMSRLLDNFFVGAQPLYWLEVLSLMGETPVAISALRGFKSTIANFDGRHQHAVEDLFRFVLAFITPISTSAPHIYVSALPFTPTESTLWKHTRESFPNLINMCTGRLQIWPKYVGVWKHTSNVVSLAYSPDGRYLASGSTDHSIRIWDTETGTQVGEPLRGHTESVSSVAYSPDGRHIVSGSYDRKILIWDAETGSPVGGSLKGHTGLVSSVAYSPDGRHIVSGGSDMLHGDAMIRIWDAEMGEPVGEPLEGHTSWVNSVAYSPDGRNIVSGSYDRTILIWDAETGSPVGESLKGHTGSVNSVAYSPDGRHIVSGSGDMLHGDATIRIWDAKTGAPVGEPLEGHTGAFKSVAYSPDGRHIVSGGRDKTIRIWDAKTGAPVGEPLEGHTDPVISVAYSPDGQHIVSGRGDMFGRDATVQVRDAKTGVPVGEPLEGHTGLVSSVAYSPDGRHIVSGSHDKTIRIWDAKTGAPVGEPLEGHANRANSVAYSPDGQHIVSGRGDILGGDATIQVWNAKTGAPVGEPLEGHTGLVSSVAYSPDGRHIVSGSHDKTIRIWDAKTGAPVGEPFEGHTNRVNSVAYSPDGQHIASGSHDKTIRIWDAKTGAPVGEPLEGHTDSVNSVAYSPDGQHIVSGSGNMFGRDATILVWDAKTGAPVGEPLEGHTGMVSSVVYSPDGRYIVSGSYDETIRIWDAEAKTENVDTHFSVSTFSGHAIPAKYLNSNGWIRNAEGLLFWVPEDCRNGLCNPILMIIPHMDRHRRVRLDFTHFCYGTSWTNIFVGNAPEMDHGSYLITG